MRIIDAHVHFLPPEVKENLASYTRDEPYWGLLLDPPTGKSVQAYASAERMIADMDAAGVEKVVVVGEYFQNHDRCVARNNQAIDLVNRYPDRVLALAMIQPLAGQAAMDELQRCLDAGLHGVGELNPYAQGFRLDDPAFGKVAEFCIEADWPINLHVNEEVGRYYPGKSGTPLRHYVDLADRYRELKLIFAHWGGGLIFYELMPSVKTMLKNVVYDTAASPLQYPTKAIFEVAMTCLDPHKLLFGSDYPLRLFPKEETEAGMSRFLAEIDALGLDDQFLSRFFADNVLQCFGLGESAEGPSRLSKEKRPRTRFKPYTPLRVIRDYPAAAETLAKYRLLKVDEPNPAWEPLAQALAIQGISAERQAEILAELNEVFDDE